LKTEEYITEVMPDGHLFLPEKVAARLKLKPYTSVRVIIQKEEQRIMSDKAKQKADAIKQFLSDMGPEDLSENFRERYK
jgi:bifunctional DNA-binding transcriptional regulator/antitoxin component of YhaV-PrlF toxin-antitoxin module